LASDTFLTTSVAIAAVFSAPGARTANIMACAGQSAARAIVAVSGYLIANREANRQPLTRPSEYAWWYQYSFATEREGGYRDHRRDFSKLVWRLASPKWQSDEATSDRAARSVDNPITLPS
jgi:hypothetical protein